MEVVPQRALYIEKIWTWMAKASVEPALLATNWDQKVWTYCCDVMTDLAATTINPLL
jgi:hypothetical protein